MAHLKKIKERIAEIATRRNNTTLDDIAWVVRQLEKAGYSTGARSAGHQILYRVGEHRFGVCRHNPGSSQVKACYVDDFLDAMIELELYDE